MARPRSRRIRHGVSSTVRAISRGRSITRRGSTSRSPTVSQFSWPSRSRSRSTVTSRDIAAAASGAIIGGITDNVPGAVAGGILAYNRSRSRSASNLRRSRKVNFSTGRYVGAFKKPRKLKSNHETKALQQGYAATIEQYGRVDDPDCCYLGHSSYNQGAIARAIVGAIYRKLFRVAGCDISNSENVLPLSYMNSSQKWRIQYTLMEPLTGTQTAHDWDINVNYSFRGLVLDSFVAGRLGDYLITSFLTGATAKDLYSVQLYSKDLDTNGGFDLSEYRQHATLKMADESVHISISSKLVVQNRTKAELANGEDVGLDATRIDNQPLKGFHYSFKSADPRLRCVDSTQPLMNFIPVNGLLLYRSAEFTNALPGTDGLWTEPPNPKIWMNCDGSARVALQPGNIKTSYLKHSYNGLFGMIQRKLFPNLAATNPFSPTTYIATGLSGKCNLIALEEMLRTDTTNKITLNYENEYRIGCYLSTRKKKTALLSFMSSENINRLTP